MQHLYRPVIVRICAREHDHIFIDRCVYISGRAQQQTFSVEPNDTQVTEGSTATLRCSVTNKAGALSWIKDGSPVSADGVIIDTANTRYSIQGDGTSTFDLQITGAVLADAGVFQCLVGAGGVGNSEILSKSATLTVLGMHRWKIDEFYLGSFS